MANILPQTKGVKQAEDLWGNRINFSRIIHSSRTTVIQPYSASNCGYCLFDGWFISKNYFGTNKMKGGINFTQCLFNPQLDNYAFSKHYQDEGIPVLTYPPGLHQYHQDGFPAILAFRKGVQIVKIPEGSLYPYDSSWERLKMTLWNDSALRFQPVSDLQFATRIIYENGCFSALCVVPDGDTAGLNRNREFADRAKCYVVKFLSQVADSDMKRNVMFEGKFPHEIYSRISGGESPFAFINDSVICIGPYRFGADTTGITACYPNPLDRTKYVVVRIRGKEVEKGFFDNSVDYTIYSFNKNTGSNRILLHGFFDKHAGNRWKFSDSLCVSNIRKPKDCIGVCSAPEKKFYPEHPVRIQAPLWKRVQERGEYTLGTGSCRFPSIAADDSGTAWVSWEENGDILLSSVDRKNPLRFAIEHDGSDSYNPILVFSGGKLWIFYLNNRDGFYRLYGCTFDGSVSSNPILLSQKLPCDVITPAVVSSGETITLAWSCWRANLRYPFFRNIRHGLPDSIQPVRVVASASVPGYINAWFFSLAVDTTGTAWGAWNQHYPATLGVCSGNLDGIPVSVTRVSDDMEASENGGYPGVLTDGDNRRWVFWESFAWDVLDGDRQKICGAWFDDVSGTWSSPVTLPLDQETFLNQTPQAAALPGGRICVAWSGRTRGSDWAIYLAIRDHNAWTGPFRLTSGREPARAPKIIATRKNGVWIACHYGKGKNMKIRIYKVVK